MFKEETQDNVGFLTIQQFKNLLSNKLNLNFSENVVSLKINFSRGGKIKMNSVFCVAKNVILQM